MHGRLGSEAPLTAGPSRLRLRDWVVFAAAGLLWLALRLLLLLLVLAPVAGFARLFLSAVR